MDWANERYVRVYTRDTADWDALSWQAQALFVLLLRKVDRSGVYDMGRQGGRAVANTLKMPPELVESALDELLEDGCLEHHGRSLVVPNFLEAQEAAQSDRHRMREMRARRREIARSEPVTAGYDALRAVTNRNGVPDPVDNSQSANPAESPEPVTSCYEALQTVTDSHSSLTSLTSLTNQTNQNKREPLAHAPARAIPVVPSTDCPVPVPVDRETIDRLARRACGERLWNAHQTARKGVAATLSREARDLPVTDQGRSLLADRLLELHLPGTDLADIERRCREVVERTARECERDNTLRYLTGQLWEKRRFDTALALVDEPVASKRVNGARRSGLTALLDDIREAEARGEK
jgi:hypothetical protein